LKKRYCGVKETGFRAYDPEQRMILSLEDDPEECVFDDEEEWEEEGFGWPDAEGVTLIDEDEADDYNRPSDEEELFTCSSCGESLSLNRKGCGKIYCYYCGKEIR